MKTRIFGGLLVLGVLFALFVLTGGDNANQTPTVQPIVPNQSDNNFKDLKIN